MATNQNRIYEFGPCRVDTTERILLRDGRPVALTPKVFDTLVFFVENAGRLIEREELMDRLWPGTFVEEGNLAFNISVLRKALGEWENGHHYIKTVPKRGYRFVAPVQCVGAVREPTPQVAAAVQIVGAVREPPLQIAQSPSESHIPNALGGKRFRFALASAVLAITGALVYWLLRPLPTPVISRVRQLTHDSLEKLGPLLTDGPRLYFQEKRRNRWVPVSMLAAGGETSVAPIPSPSVVASDISADGSQFLGTDVSEDTDRLVTWPVTGGPAEYVGELRGWSAAWSPDGARIAYIDEKNRLMVTGRSGEAPREIRVAATGARWFPQWSSDGRKLRFSVQDPKSQTSSLWEVRTDGSSPPRVLSARTDAPIGLSAVGWTADSAFSFISSLGPEGPPPDRSGRGSGVDLWALRENCGLLFWRWRKPLPLAIGATRYFAPLPSRDGKSVFAIGSQSLRRLERHDQESGAFVPYLSGTAAADLDFSRDGNWVAYIRVPDHTLWRSKADGSDPRQLSSPNEFGEARRPHWSPDGSEIAFMGVSASQRYKAYVVPARGGIPQPLVPGDGEEGVPTWSRDGKSLVWGDPIDRRPPPEMTIHQLDLSTGRVTTLPDSSGFWTARWSPDGRYVAALAIDALTGDVQSHYPGAKFRASGLWLFDLNTKKWARLVFMIHIQELTWASDGKHIYFNTVGSNRAVYGVRIADGDVEPLLSLNGLSSDSDWAGVTPDGSPLVLRSVNFQEVYALDLTWR